MATEVFKNGYLNITNSAQTIYTAPTDAGDVAIVLSLRVTNVDGSTDDTITAEVKDQGGSLDAKVAKLNNKLKIVELQLKKEKQDKDSNTNDGDIVNGAGYVVTDRNSLLEKLKGLDKNGDT